MKSHITNGTPVPDRRIERTRHGLADALIALVLEKGYEAVTVQDIIDRANVGRSTFYAHFENKEQLLFSGRGWLTEELFAEPTGNDNLTYGVNLQSLFDHAAGNYRLAKAMLGKNSGDLIINHISELLYMQFRKALKPKLPNETKRLLTAQAMASLLTGLLRSWLEHDMPLLPDEVARIAKRMLEGSVHEDKE